MCRELGSGCIAARISDLDDGFLDDSLGYCASVGYLFGLFTRFVVAVRGHRAWNPIALRSALRAERAEIVPVGDRFGRYHDKTALQPTI
jgi:hypothetical protein